MASSFPRASLALEPPRRPGVLAGALLVAAFVAAWGWWFIVASVSIYAVSEAARVEVERAPSPVDAPAAGRVIRSSLALGRHVNEGDVLVELDTDIQALEVNEQRAEVSAVAPQIDRLEAEIRGEETAGASDRRATDVAIAEARARYAEALASADLADEEVQRAEKLHAGRLVSDVDLLRAQAEAKRRRAGAETLRLNIERLAIEQGRRASDVQIRIARLQREVAALRGRSVTGSAAIQRLEREGARRRILAPATGTLAEVSEIRIGAYIREGNRVATVVPSGDLRVVSQFAPGSALGRVQKGQTARVRLEGFPWTTHGSVIATVTNVAEEVRDGRVRVELAITRVPPSITLEHGLPGAVEVDVEQLSPAALVLRAAGARLTTLRRQPTSAALGP
jgi:multidrug resistance efflux pump